MTLRRSLLVSMFETGSVLVQFAYFLLWGYYFGARPEMDAFLTSVALPMVLAAVTTGPLISSLVPILVEQNIHRIPEEVNRLQNNLLNIFFLGGVALAAPIFFSPGTIVRLIAPGLKPESLRLAAQLLRIEALALPLMIIAGVLVSFFYVRERFYRPTIAPLAGSLAALLLLVLVQKKLGIYVLAWGLLLSTLVQLLLLSGIILRNYSPCLDWRDPGFRQLMKKMAPLSAGNLYYKSDALVDRFIASFLPAGSISYLGYGQRIHQAVNQVLNRGLITTRFPEMAASKEKNIEEFKRTLHRLLEKVLFVAIFLTAALLLLAYPGIRLLLQRGAFTVADSGHTAAVLIALVGLMVGGLLGSVLANTFYALGDTKTIAQIGVAVFSVGILLKIGGVLLFSYVGVAAATSAYFLLAAVVEMTVLQKRLRLFNLRTIGAELLKMTVAGLLAFSAGFFVKRAAGHALPGVLATLGITLVTYLLASWKLGILTATGLRDLLPWTKTGTTAHDD